jgi:hypothetical protein
MPLAILRKQVRDLPVSFRLDDSMAMAPNLALSNFADLVVGARVSKVRQRDAAKRRPGGHLAGRSRSVVSGISVVIDPRAALRGPRAHDCVWWWQPDDEPLIQVKVQRRRRRDLPFAARYFQLAVA